MFFTSTLDAPTPSRERDGDASWRDQKESHSPAEVGDAPFSHPHGTVMKGTSPISSRRRLRSRCFDRGSRPSLRRHPRSYSNGGTVLNQETMESTSVSSILLK
jgi:hypothetical protein